MANSKEPSKFSLAVKAALAKRNMTPSQLAAKLNSPYDALRKVIKGDMFPSPKLLRMICEELKLDLVTMNYFLDQDRKKDGLDDGPGDVLV